MGTKYIVNNVSGQSINGQQLQPYKVYTALLTQSGGDNRESITSGSLVIGRTYEITNYQAGDDFTNVGAPSNSTSIKFVATGETPSVWTNSSELTWNYGAPEVVVLENTIGNIWFTYILPAFYQANSDGLFIINKTFGQGTSTTAEDGTTFTVFTVLPNNINTVNIYSTNPSSESASDNLLNNTPIEIRVYN